MTAEGVEGREGNSFVSFRMSLLEHVRPLSAYLFLLNFLLPPSKLPPFDATIHLKQVVETLIPLKLKYNLNFT
jgi:hypothetical protein